ncbi:hypothetical protein ACFC26_12475 [Kitasatospora purpeofusca]|uniref:hypothetical protein n=1 Tax=Kitasatospora purpeofusca TaxID=67352 RepID=UPI0035E06522
MNRTLLTAAAGTALTAAGITLLLRRSTAAPLAVPAEETDPWGQPSCPPPDGVALLHDWLSSGDWASPTHVLEALRERTPAQLLANLVRDLATDLRTGGHPGLAAQAGEAEHLLRQAADLLGEDDYDPNEDGSPCPDEPHDPLCEGGCGGTGMVMETMTWDDQGDGIYVPVHQEPTDCPGGRQPHPQPHAAACGCSGTGFTFEGGYRHRCLGDRPPAPDLPPLDDPWASAPPYANADDYPG